MPCVGVLNNRAVGYFMSGAVVKDSFVRGAIDFATEPVILGLYLIGARRIYD